MDVNYFCGVHADDQAKAETAWNRRASLAPEGKPVLWMIANDGGQIRDDGEQLCVADHPSVLHHELAHAQQDEPDDGWEIRPLYDHPARQEGWIPTRERLPEEGTPVLILRKGETRIGERRWERPAYEETFSAFWFWDDPSNEGQDWENDEITYWRPLPPPPGDER
jgi:hypothetical protein